MRLFVYMFFYSLNGVNHRPVAALFLEALEAGEDTHGEYKLFFLKSP